MRSITDFAKNFYILPETGRHIVLLPHQEKILKTCFTKNKQGKFPYQTIIYSCIKKSGKTEIEGLVGLWYGTDQTELYNEIYFIANDLEQSQSRGFKRISRIIQSNPDLDDINVKKSVIDMLKTGTEIQALSSDYAGEAGANPGLTLWDELWAYSSENSRRLWDELTPSPTRQNSLRFIATYAGFEGESELLWELHQLINEDKGGGRLWSDEEIDTFKYNRKPMEEIYKDALRCVYVNDEAGVFIYWDHEPRMDWQLGKDGEGYYKRERKILRPNAFRRLHQNEWVSSTTSYIPIDAWDDCTDPTISPIIPPLSNPLFLGVDIGIKRDSTAIVGVYWDSEANKMRLALHRIWQPTKAEPVDLEHTIEAYILDIHTHFRIGALYYDPSQFVRSAQFLAGQGIPLTEYTQVPTNLISMTQTLYELIRGRNLIMYPSSELRKQNLDAVIIEGSRGMRIAKEKATQKIDAIVAMAMACQAAWDGSGLTPLPDSQPERPSTWLFSEGSASIVELDGEPLSRSKWRI